MEREKAIHAGAVALYGLGHAPTQPYSRREQAEAVLIAVGLVEPTDSGPLPTSSWVAYEGLMARAEVTGTPKPERPADGDV